MDRNDLNDNGHIQECQVRQVYMCFWSRFNEGVRFNSEHERRSRRDELGAHVSANARGDEGDVPVEALLRTPSPISHISETKAISTAIHS